MRINGKHFLTGLLVTVLVLSGLTVGFAEEGAAGLDNFSKSKQYNNQFTDVKSSDWFNENVKEVYEYGLMVGMSDTKFSPKSNVTIAQAFTIAARLNQIYETGTENFSEGSPWYQVYLDYAAEKGILSDSRVLVSGRANNPATRAEFAAILANCLPKEELDEINPVVSGSIPDVASNRMYARDIYRLYRAGIIVGNDKKGTFAPDKNITRAEVAAIVTRMVDRKLRMQIDPNSPLITGVKSGRMEMEIDWPNGDPYFAVYDGDGRLIEKLNLVSDVITRKYDTFGNWSSTKEYTASMDGYDAFSYDVFSADDGSSFEYSSEDDSGYATQYDQTGLPVKTVQIQSLTDERITYQVEFSYSYLRDEYGRISQVVTKDYEDTVQGRIMVSYDGNGRIKEVTDINYNNYVTTTKDVYKYYYNAKGQVRLCSVDMVWEDGDVTYEGAKKYEYNSDGFLQYVEEIGSDNQAYRGVYYVYGNALKPYIVTSLNVWEKDLWDIDADGNENEIFRYTYPIN